VTVASFFARVAALAPRIVTMSSAALAALLGLAAIVLARAGAVVQATILAAAAGAAVALALLTSDRANPDKGDGMKKTSLEDAERTLRAAAVAHANAMSNGGDTPATQAVLDEACLYYADMTNERSARPRR